MNLRRMLSDIAEASVAFSGWVLLITLTWTLTAAVLYGAYFVFQEVTGW